VAYPDALLEEKNKELHRHLKSVPATDYVIEFFPASLQKDILLQGKCYITQNRLCFYSNILGFINIVCEINKVGNLPEGYQRYRKKSWNDKSEHIY
jgi:hypothetical protein